MSEEYILVEYRARETHQHTLDELDQDMDERSAMFGQLHDEIGLYVAAWRSNIAEAKRDGIISTYSFNLVFKKDKSFHKRLREIRSVLQTEPLNRFVRSRNGIYLDLNATSVIDQAEADDYALEGCVEKDDSEEEV